MLHLVEKYVAIFPSGEAPFQTLNVDETMSGSLSNKSKSDVKVFLSFRKHDVIYIQYIH